MSRRSVMKNVTLISLLNLILTFQFLPAQTPDTLWTKLFGGSDNETGYDVQLTSDGGYIIVGETTSYGAGYYDVWIIKTDLSGDTLWTRTYGGAHDDHGYSIQQTMDGGYIIIGTTSSFGAGGPDIWLLKIDEFGDTLWTKTFGGNNSEWGHGVQQTSNDGFIIVGDTMTALGYADVWLIKTDLAGNPLWTKNYGGSSNEVGYSVQQTTDGGYILTGFTSSYGAGNSDVWIIKTDASGDTLWTKTLGRSSIDRSRSIKQISNGEYIITGNTDSFSTLGVDLWLIKLGSGTSGFHKNRDRIVSKNYSLTRNYPNPFNPTTVISWQSC